MLVVSAGSADQERQKCLLQVEAAAIVVLQTLPLRAQRTKATHPDLVAKNVCRCARKGGGVLRSRGYNAHKLGFQRLWKEQEVYCLGVVRKGVKRVVVLRKKANGTTKRENYSRQSKIPACYK